MVGTRHSSKRFKAATVESALFNADILASIAPYLAADDLANLSSTCRHFGGKRCSANDEALPLVQAVARQMIGKITETERSALVRYPGESWIALYHQLCLLRAPLQFDRRVGKHLEWVGGDKSRVVLTNSMASCTKSAFSNYIMRGGKHYVEFPVELHDGRAPSASVGIMRPAPEGWGRVNENHFEPVYLKKKFAQELLAGRSERWGESNINCCMYRFPIGSCAWSDWETNQMKYHRWEGQEGLDEGVGGSSVSRRAASFMPDNFFGQLDFDADVEQPTEIVLGLLLDVDGGTLSVYKDGRRLGVMCDGLSGEYCWVASFHRTRNQAISIRRAAIPIDA